MTTVAFRDGVVAYDSRITAEGLIRDDAAEKCTLRNGVRFFFLGATADNERFMALYFGGSDDFKDIGCSAVVVDGEKLLLVAVAHETGMWRQPQRKDRYFSEGSGSDHAITAMDMGATAKEAVKWASKRDSCTGGRIRTFKL